MTLTAISLFSGAGGLDYGLEASGISTRLAVEIDRDCCASLRANRKWTVLERSVVGLRALEILSAAKLDKGAVDLLVGGPPCQPFSKSANWATGHPKGLLDPRSQTLVEMLRLVEDLLPRILLVENVPGFSRHGGLDFLIKRLTEINTKNGTSYRVSASVLNAADFGVPQIRRRLVVVADREGREFVFPKATHGEGSSRGWLTAWDAIGGLAPDAYQHEDLRVKGRWAALLPSIPEGCNYLWHTDRGPGHNIFGWRTRYWSFLLKLSKAKPSWTIAASPSQNHGPYHWDNRLLSTTELLRLQTFPRDAVILGDQASRQRQLGNAVPSLLGEILGRSISKHLNPRARFRSDLKLSVPSRTDRPRANRRSAVADIYLSNVGTHLAHPGTGKGPGAKKRMSSGAGE